jgi:Domain of unknown function (DUF6265)
MSRSFKPVDPKGAIDAGRKGMAMKSIALLIGLALMATPAPAAERPAVPDLGWMSGEWVQESATGWTRESWARPRAGVMLGTSLSGRGDEALEHEFMRIAPGPDGILTYFASPGGASPVPFRLVSASNRQAAFENPEHDYPVRIEYRRDGKALIAKISGPAGRNPRTWQYRRARD